MLRNVVLKTLRDGRRALLFWAIGLALLNVYMAMFYPSIKDSGAALNQFIDQMPEALKAMFLGSGGDYTSPAGYLSTELFAFMGPLLFLFYTIGAGSAAIAGEEDRGTLDLLLANPLPRFRLVLEKAGGMAIATFVLAFAFWVSLALGVRAVDMDISLARLGEGTVSMALLGLAFGGLALAVGAATGNRGLSIGVASAVGVGAYFLNSLAVLVEELKPFQKISPFYYYTQNEPLRNGLDLGHAGVLLGLALLLVIVATVAFERRDLAV